MERVRHLPRAEQALLAAAIVLLLAAVVLFQRSSTTADDLASAEEQLASGEEQLREVQTGDEKEKLRARIQELSEREDPVQLPTRQRAQEVTTALANHAANQGLGVSTFESAPTRAAIAGMERAAIRNSLEAQGTPGQLVGILQVVGTFPSARVQTVGLVKVPETENLWELSLTVIAPYSEEDDSA